MRFASFVTGTGTDTFSRNQQDFCLCDDHLNFQKAGKIQMSAMPAKAVFGISARGELIR